jgi:hypothetical protein
MKILRNVSIAVIGAAAMAIGSSGASYAASFVDFESPELRGLSDNGSITNQYADLGFTFGIDNDLDGRADSGIAPALEAVGQSDSTAGFVNRGMGNDVAENGFFDQEKGITYADRLGEYFLRTGGLGGDGGNLLISYTAGTSAASGELWDIDGNRNWNKAGIQHRTEQWEVQALGHDYSILERLTSPLGEHVDGELDGKPWLWSFNRDSADIKAIRFVFTGDSTSQAVGLAFDNFSAYSVEGESVPEPASLAGLALLGLVGGRSLLSKRKSAE